MVKKLWSNSSKIETFLILFLAILVMIISGNTSQVSFGSLLILPIPIAIFYLKFDRKNSLWFLIFMSILNYFLSGSIGTITALFLTAMVGITFGYCIQNQKDSVFTIKVVTLISIACLSISLLLYAIIKNISIIDNFNNTMNSFIKGIDNVIENYKSAGISQVNLTPLENFKEILTSKAVLGFLPSVAIFYTLIFNTINYFIIKRILKTSNVEGIKKVGFSKFYITNIIGAILIGISCIGIILSSKGIEVGEYLEIDGIALTELVLLLNGMAALTYFLRIKLKRKRISIFFIILLIFIIGLQNVFLFIGLIDMLGNFRNLDPYGIRKKRNMGV